MYSRSECCCLNAIYLCYNMTTSEDLSKTTSRRICTTLPLCFRLIPLRDNAPEEAEARERHRNARELRRSRRRRTLPGPRLSATTAKKPLPEVFEEAMTDESMVNRKAKGRDTSSARRRSGTMKLRLSCTLEPLLSLGYQLAIGMMPCTTSQQRIQSHPFLPTSDFPITQGPNTVHPRDGDLPSSHLFRRPPLERPALQELHKHHP